VNATQARLKQALRRRIAVMNCNQREAYFNEEDNAKSYVVERGRAYIGDGADLCFGSTVERKRR
jgi:hypothetical protein